MIDVKFNEFVDIVKKLRKECPWDKKQTNDSIKSATIEEAYEVVHAIDEQDFIELKKELGDLLLHVVFHSVIAEEKKYFSFEEVIIEITEKLIRRHPHVFGNVKVADADDVKKNWEVIKLEEGRNSLLDGIPASLPALLTAYKMQEKASKVGFDWSNKEDVWKKVSEELNEFHQAEVEQNHEKIKEEFGDLLFALTNYARFININPEDSLRQTNNKFVKRFNYIEQKLSEQNKKITDSTLDEMDFYWNESKSFI